MPTYICTISFSQESKKYSRYAENLHKNREEHAYIKLLKIENKKVNNEAELLMVNGW